MRGWTQINLRVAGGKSEKTFDDGLRGKTQEEVVETATVATQPFVGGGARETPLPRVQNCYLSQCRSDGDD